MITSTTTIQTPRFGRIDFAAEDVLHLTSGLVGCPDWNDFLVVQHKEGSPYRWLQSIDDPDVAFLVVDPSVHFGDYAPEMPKRIAQELQMDEETPRLVYTIVTIPRGRPEDMTVNLAGPIVVNLATGQGKQVILEDERYLIRQRVFGEQTPGESAA